MILDAAIDQLINLSAEIRQASLADDKTPLGNALALGKEIKQGKFNVVAFGDINDFKTLNDIHLHKAGDLAIKKIGEKIEREFVKKLNAKAFRQSGDEFVILLKQSSIKSFQAKASAFKSVKFLYEGKFLTTKMSFGFTVGDGKTVFDDLLKRAETACLTAKNQGDGVCIEWSEEIERDALTGFRHKCFNCHSVNKCYIPKRLSPEKLKVCSFCGEKL